MANSIGYSQNIYLIDDTIEANIALSKKNLVNSNKVKVSNIANLHNFITNELPMDINQSW